VGCFGGWDVWTRVVRTMRAGTTCPTFCMILVHTWHYTSSAPAGHLPLKGKAMVGCLLEGRCTSMRRVRLHRIGSPARGAGCRRQTEGLGAVHRPDVCVNVSAYCALSLPQSAALTAPSSEGAQPLSLPSAASSPCRGAFGWVLAHCLPLEGKVARRVG